MDKIVLNEEQLRNVIRETIEGILSEGINEMSPEFYAAQAEKARNASTGLKGLFNKGWAARKKNQAKRFDDMAYNHPDAEWDAIDMDDGYYSFSSGNVYKKLGPDGEDEFHRLTDPDTGEWTTARGTVNQYRYGKYGKETPTVKEPKKGEDWAFLKHKRPDVKGKSHPRRSVGRNSWSPTYYSQLKRDH